MKNWVPKWMKIADWINTCKFETISTSVSVRVGSSVSAFSVEWLMDVSNIMNQKSEVEAISKIPWDCSLVGNWFFSFSIFQSTDKFTHYPSNVEFLWMPVWFCESVIKEWIVNKVPIWLIIPSFWLDFVSKGSALNKWVILFKSSKWGEMSKDWVCSCNNIWAFGLKFIISNSGG